MLTPEITALPIPVLLLDSSLRVLAVNDAARPMLERLRPGAGRKAGSASLLELLPAAAPELARWREAAVPELAVDCAAADGSSIRVSLKRNEADDESRVYGVLHELAPSARAGRLPSRVAAYADALLRTAGVLILVMDDQGNLIHCNPAFEQLTGYSEEELRATNWFETLVPKERYPDVWADVRQYRAAAPPREYANPILTHAGEERWIVWRNSVLEREDGVVETVTVGLDMTELNQAQEQLRHSEHRSRTLLASLPQRIFFKDEHGRFVMVNEPFAADFDLASSDFAGKTDADFFPAEMAEKFRADDRVVMQTRQSYQLVETNHVGGRTRFVEVVKAPVIGDDGRVLGVLGVFTDISDRKRMEEELAHERDLLHILMDSIPDLIYFKDQRSRFTRVNMTQAAHLGANSPEDLVGKSDFDFFPSDEATHFFEDEQEIIRTGTPMLGKTEQATSGRGEARWMSSTKAPVFNSAGEVIGIVGVGRDITERMQAEAELQKIAAELARSNEELEQFAYVASHDLQEPLRMVASYTQLLARRYRDQLDEDGVEFINYAVDGATRMQRLIQDLLAYSRVGTRGKPFERVDLNDLVARVCDHLRLTTEEQGAVINVETLPTLLADSTQMSQLFQNLIGNAVKFHGPEAPRVHVSAAWRDGEWLFRVRDNGIGIDPAYAEKIFVIFQRLHGKAEYAGSGIGLSICKKIVLRHGGRIWVESALGSGSTFCFTMPDLPSPPRTALPSGN